MESRLQCHQPDYAFLLGAGAAAVASGSLVAANGIAHADAYSSWTSPFALTIGAMAITLCASLAAIYLAVEASQDKDDPLAEIYRTRALISGAVTAVLGALGLSLSTSEAPLSGTACLPALFLSSSSRCWLAWQLL